LKSAPQKSLLCCIPTQNKQRMIGLHKLERPVSDVCQCSTVRVDVSSNNRINSSMECMAINKEWCEETAIIHTNKTKIMTMTTSMTYCTLQGPEQPQTILQPSLIKKFCRSMRSLMLAWKLKREWQRFPRNRVFKHGHNSQYQVNTGF
jgi:hypothetical protein